MTCGAFFTFETGAATDVGCRRQVNEDSMMASPATGLWLVADGMGGHAAGDFASQTIVKDLETVGIAGSLVDFEARVMDRLARANRHILDHAVQLDRGMVGATVVALLVHGPEYACIWSGDSRAYLLRDGHLVQQSSDHTEVRALLDAGSITQAEADNWPRRNVITRAIGVTDAPECDIVEGTLQANDRFLLCSDGLTEHLSDDDIARFMRCDTPQEGCDRMIAETLSRGAKDNVTVVVMRCQPVPLPDDTDEDFETAMMDQQT